MGGKNWGKYGNSTPFLVSGKSEICRFLVGGPAGGFDFESYFLAGGRARKAGFFFQCTSRRDLSNGTNLRSNRALVVEIGTPKVGRQKWRKIPKYVYYH